jgi:hypothetical protein
MGRFHFLFLILLGFPGGVPGAEHAHGALNSERAAQAELGAQAAFDPQGGLWAVHKVSGHITVSHSADRGRTWSSPVLVTPAPEPTDTGGDARPKIALGAAGEIYLTWTKPLAKPYTGEIRFARSLDGGRTFSAPIVVHHDRQEITHRFDTIAVTRDGKLFVAWIDKRDLGADADSLKPAYRGAAVYFAVSDDRGASFRGDFKAADHACECCRLALAPRSDGGAMVMWRHIFHPNVRDHAVTTLFPDGTTSALQRASFEDWRIDACPHHGPALAVDGANRRHAVWFSGAPERRGVFYGRPRENGGDLPRRIGGDGAGHADLAVDGLNVAIAWTSYADGRTQLRGMISGDGGKTGHEMELASVAGPADYARVLAFGGQFYVFWHSREAPLRVVAFPLTREGI